MIEIRTTQGDLWHLEIDGCMWHYLECKDGLETCGSGHLKGKQVVECDGCPSRLTSHNSVPEGGWYKGRKGSYAIRCWRNYLRMRNHMETQQEIISAPFCDAAASNQAAHMIDKIQGAMDSWGPSIEKMLSTGVGGELQHIAGPSSAEVALAEAAKQHKSRHGKLKRKLNKLGFFLYIGAELGGRHDFRNGDPEKFYYISDRQYGDSIPGGCMANGGLSLDDVEDWIRARVCNKRAAIAATKAKQGV